MAGFFGESWDDPKTQMILAMASGLLGNRGNLAQGMGAGLAAGLPAYQGAQKMQMLREQQEAQNELRRAQAERARAMQERGIDPNVPAAIQIYEYGQKNLKTPEQRADFERYQRGANIFEMNGIKYFMDPARGPVPLTTIQAEGEAQNYLSAMKSRGTEQEKANFDLVTGWNRDARRLESVPRSTQVGPLPPLVAPGGPRIPSASAPGSYGGMPGYMDPAAQQRAWNQFGGSRLPNDQMQPAPQSGAPATPPMPQPTAPRIEPPEQAKRDDERRADDRKYQNILTQIREAKTWLPSATNSGVGRLLDSAGAAVGVDLPGASAAKRLEAIAGWLTSNVPRMEGPQSNFDVQVYQKMAADVGNAGLPMSQRLAALETLESLMMKQEAIRQQLNGGQAPQQASAQEAFGGGLPKINSDAEFNALPSGAEFIGPDGKRRRKP